MVTVGEPAPEMPVPRGCPYAPPAEHTRLREEAPVSRIMLPTGKTAWAVTRHEDIRSVLTDPRFSSDRAHPDFPALSPARADPPPNRMRPSMIMMDPPDHRPARRSVVGEFTVRQIAAMRPRIQQITDTCIDTMLAGPRPVDLVQALSLPVPSLVICGLLGVPYADHDFFQERSATLLNLTSTPEEIDKAVVALKSYLDGLIAEKEKAPTDDLLSRQILKRRGTGGAASEEDREDVASLALLLLVAGHETTANMISLGTIALLERPDDISAIREDPGKTPAAIEELLRYFTIAEFATSRLAKEDVEIGGALIRAGEAVLTFGNTANRDPEVFENPDELDIERTANHHIAFGFGAHQCLGQNLARIELQIVFDTLFRRIPGLELAVPFDELTFKDDSNVYGVRRLPVTW
ncbi:cytochrome P450 [Streptomyces sp. NPDC088400]|uniref:cytochrome P450 n=1 Tax=Streptomyces sp. NPDC088400 TaxID=3365861 RepID=UPI0038168B9A